MPTIEELDSDTRAALFDHVARIKHDLGKYVAFQIRWLSDDASDAERLEALTADLLHTRRGPDGSSDVLDVWNPARAVLFGEAELRGGLVVDVSEDPAVAELDARMGAVAAAVALLRAAAADDAAVRRGMDAALAVADACKQLHSRVRAGGR